MGLRRRLLRVLDRGARRRILAVASTHFARQITEDPVCRITYDEGWAHLSGGVWWPDGETWSYSKGRMQRWRAKAMRLDDSVCDFYMHRYTPAAGHVVMDVGAGAGEDLLPFLRRIGDTGSIWAIEAHPATYRRLVAFCRLNSLHNVQPVHLAATDVPGSVAIGGESDWQNNSIITARGADIAEVQTDTLDHLSAVQGIRHLDFLKMNIEGAEGAALRGAQGLLQRTAAVCVCCHDFRADRGDGEGFRTRAEVAALLQAAGFTTHERTDSRPHVSDQLWGVREPPAR